MVKDGYNDEGVDEELDFPVHLVVDFVAGQGEESVVHEEQVEEEELVQVAALAALVDHDDVGKHQHQRVFDEVGLEERLEGVLEVLLRVVLQPGQPTATEPRGRSRTCSSKSRTRRTCGRSAACRCDCRSGRACCSW